MYLITKTPFESETCAYPWATLKGSENPVKNNKNSSCLKACTHWVVIAKAKTIGFNHQLNIEANQGHVSPLCYPNQSQHREKLHCTCWASPLHFISSNCALVTWKQLSHSTKSKQNQEACSVYGSFSSEFHLFNTLFNCNYEIFSHTWAVLNTENCMSIMIAQIQTEKFCWLAFRHLWSILSDMSFAVWAVMLQGRRLLGHPMEWQQGSWKETSSRVACNQPSKAHTREQGKYQAHSLKMSLPLYSQMMWTHSSSSHPGPRTGNSAFRWGQFWDLWWGKLALLGEAWARVC